MLDFSYHEKYIQLYLNQTTLDDGKKIALDGNFSFKTHLSWIRSVTGNYELSKHEENFNLKFNLSKDHHFLRLDSEGTTGKLDKRIKFRVQQNFYGDQDVDGKIQLKSENLGTYFMLKMKNKMRRMKLIVRLDEGVSPEFKLDLHIDGDVNARFRISFIDNDEKKTLKTELRYQNRQIAGCNFQFSLNSAKEFMIIAKAKLEHNKVEFDVINSERDAYQLFHFNIFLENQNIFLLKFENKSEKEKNNINLKLSSLSNLLHQVDITQESAADKEFFRSNATITVNEFDGNFQWQHNDQSLLFTFNSNLDVISKGNLSYKYEQHDDESITKFGFQLNQKTLDMEIGVTPASTNFTLSGPWGSVHGILTWRTFEEKEMFVVFEFLDNAGQTSKLEAKLQNSQHKSILLEIHTPFSGHLFELQYSPSQNYVEISLMDLSTKSYLINIEIKMENSNTTLMGELSFTSSWMPSILFKFKSDVVFQLESFSSEMVLKVADQDLCSFETNLRKMDQTFKINSSVKTRLEGLTDLKLFAKIEEKSVSINITEVSNQILKLEASHDISGLKFLMQFSTWNTLLKIELPISMDSLSVELTTLNNSFKLAGTWNIESKAVSGEVQVLTTFHSFHSLNASMNVENSQIQLKLSTDDDSYDIQVNGETSANSVNLSLVAKIPFLFSHTKLISTSILWTENRYEAEASFDGETFKFLMNLDEHINIKIKTPFPKFKNIDAIIKLNETLQHYNAVVAINDLMINVTLNSDQQIKNLSITTNNQWIKNFSVNVNYQDFKNILFDGRLNNNSFYFSFNYQHQRKFKSLIKVGTDEMNINLGYGHDLQFNEIQGTVSVNLKRSQLNHHLEFSYKESTLQAELNSPFFKTVKLQLSWHWGKLKLHLSVDGETVVLTELRSYNVQDWIGSKKLVLYIKGFKMNKLTINSNYSLLGKQKLFESISSYGNKVFCIILSKLNLL